MTLLEGAAVSTWGLSTDSIEKEDFFYVDYKFSQVSGPWCTMLWGLWDRAP